MRVSASLLLALSNTEDGMAKKQSSRRVPSQPPAAPRPAVTPERFTRLHRLLQLIGNEACTRERLIEQLGLDIRGFYRDLEFLRAVRITVRASEEGYTLAEPVKEALARLPFPDPHLTLGEVRQLARGRSAVHRDLLAQIERLVE
jgi:hypothetical protein